MTCTNCGGMDHALSRCPWPLVSGLCQKAPLTATPKPDTNHSRMPVPDIPDGCEMTRNWSVTVAAEGQDVLTLSSNGYSGLRDLDPWESTIRGCAQHLLAFIGHAGDHSQGEQAGVPAGYRLQPISEFDAYQDVLRQIGEAERDKAQLQVVLEQFLQADALLRIIKGKHSAGILRLPQADLERVDAYLRAVGTPIEAVQDGHRDPTIDCTDCLDSGRECECALAPIPQPSAAPPIPACRANPIDMVLHCPCCGVQHIDAPEETQQRYYAADLGKPLTIWTNPPHRSHLCHGCGHIWRPADVPTNGVASVKTKGKDDSPLAQSAPAEILRLHRVVAGLRQMLEAETRRADGAVTLSNATQDQLAAINAGSKGEGVREALAHLVHGMRWWARQEDGIPAEVAPAFNQAMLMLGWSYSSQTDLDALAATQPSASAQQAAPADDDPTTKSQYRRMFGAACSDLGLINEKLGLDPNDGGAEPILDAIDELRSAGETVPRTTLDRWLELLIGLSVQDGVEDVIREIRAILAAPAPSASPAERTALIPGLLKPEGAAPSPVLVTPADVDKLVPPAAEGANEVNAEAVNAGHNGAEGNLSSAANADPHGGLHAMGAELHDRRSLATVQAIRSGSPAALTDEAVDADDMAYIARLRNGSKTWLGFSKYRWDRLDSTWDKRVATSPAATQPSAKAEQDEAVIGVGDGRGKLFVRGPYEAIRRVRGFIFDAEKWRGQQAQSVKVLHGGDIAAGLFQFVEGRGWVEVGKQFAGCPSVVTLYHAAGWPINAAEQPSEDKPRSCSGTPDSCPDNEGYGCYCSDAAIAKGEGK
ncbi:hypothetical protein P3W85_29900 [Cupriavidus basilensis]|uniref:Uncharacterized protein n=1 Tax=Cupriavidus basilensis TaxID=68895 RepID=A0ABT6AWZ0_9BURK|nr:hypothetical protein [Cupriavidus basilensis]MDF3837137.1 hypothetical protein [Cupriavidus basilensis]